MHLESRTIIEPVLKMISDSTWLFFEIEIIYLVPSWNQIRNHVIEIEEFKYTMLMII